MKFEISIDLDSLGKPPTGILGGNIRWIGNYEECLRIPDSHYCDMKNVAINITIQTIVSIFVLIIIPFFDKFSNHHKHFLNPNFSL